MDLIGLITKLIKCSLLLTGYGIAFMVAILVFITLVSLIRGVWRDDS